MNNNIKLFKENKGGELTLKQKKFCKFYLQTGNGAESYRRAGYKCKNDKVATANAATMLQNPKIIDYINSETEKIYQVAGLDDSSLQKLHTDLLNAENIKIGKDENGNIIKFTTPDNITRVRSLELAYKLLNKFEENKTSVSELSLSKLIKAAQEEKNES